VLDVYGLAAAHQIKDLGDAILDADYDKILASTNQFAEMGLDFYRALLDLSEYFREKLLSSLSGGGDHQEIYPEQITRVLDALQNGESLVKLGLSEKANFEVTLFRAVESARSKSIDQVIRRITQTIPEGAKKKSPKSEVKPAPQSAPEKVLEPSPGIPGEKIQKDKSSELFAPSEPKAPDTVAKEQEIPRDLDVAENPEKEEQVEAQPPRAVDTSEKREDAPANDLRITDPDVIEQRVQALPAEIRKIVEEDFKGEYVAVEKIDPDKLI
jgi:DNA polymerase III gamma/tau subunit